MARLVPVNETQVVRMSFARDRRGPCSWILNLLWLVLGGWHLFLTWFICGLLLSISIICCPCGQQVLKIACFLLCPFGKTIACHPPQRHCGGLNCLLNLLWIVTAGWILALQAVLAGIFMCITIIGIPFGYQCFKLAYISLWPFGLDVSSEYVETVTVTTTQYAVLEEQM